MLNNYIYIENLYFKILLVKRPICQIDSSSKKG
jgi:hypothetical protein